MWLPSPTRAGDPQAKKGNSNTSIRGPQPPAPSITLLGLVWWPKHNLQLKCRKLTQARVRNSVYVGAHLIRYWGKERHKQTPWLIMPPVLAVCPTQARGHQPQPEKTAGQTAAATPPLHHNANHYSHSRAHLWVSSTRAGLPPPYFNISLAKTTHGCPCWVLLLVEGDADHGQQCAEL